MKIELAKNIGFCGGVAGAIKKAEEAAKKYGEVQMLGDIVHNDIVVKQLEKLGVHVIEDLDKIDKSKPLLLRAHGTPQQLEQKLREQNYFIIDATCPLVKEIHKEAIALEKEGRRVIIIGDHGHDEVLGIQSRLSDSMVISNANEAEEIPPIKSAGVVIQSTQFLREAGRIMAELTLKCDDIHFVNTICNPTRQRQKQVKELAQNNQLVLIVGSKTSANTKRLAEISESINYNTIPVETENELEQKWFENVTSVGISGGASTPDYVIESIKKRVQKISENLLN